MHSHLGPATIGAIGLTGEPAIVPRLAARLLTLDTSNVVQDALFVVFIESHGYQPNRSGDSAGLSSIAGPFTISTSGASLMPLPMPRLFWTCRCFCPGAVEKRPSAVDRFQLRVHVKGHDHTSLGEPPQLIR